MKFNVIAGKNSCTMDVEIDDKGRVTGSFVIPDVGSATITGTAVDSQINGELSIDGYTADFKATMQGTEIRGHLHVPFPASIEFKSTDFTGTLVA